MSEDKRQPVNYDPRRFYGDDVEPYTTFEIKGEDGKALANVSLPQVDVEGKSPEDVRREVFDFYRRMQFAEETLDSDRVKEIAEAVKPGMVKAFSQQTALHVAANVYSVYAERLDEEAVWDEDIFARFIERIETITDEWLTEYPEEYERLHVLIWQHTIAWALEHMEEDHGGEALEAMSDEAFDDLLDEYIFEKRDFANTAAGIISKHAQDMARLFVDAIDPANEPLDHLAAFIGFKREDEAAHVTRAPTSVDVEIREAAEDDIFSRMLSVPSALPYSALQEIVATQDFHKVEGVPWPVARIDKKGAKGTAQLRPAGMDEQPFMAPDEVEAWSKIMWRHREQMTALDVDVMDALAAIYLKRTRGPNESAAADVDELLAMRGLKPKKGGSGTRGGYTPKQRREVMAALSRIQSIWLDMAQMDVIEEGPKGGRKRSSKTIQSRPFVITDRMGQVRIDGYMDVERFIFKPGAVFAHYLHGPGRQTALLNAKILELDPYREAWEKNIGRYLSNLWRIRARTGTYSDPLKVQTLLERTGQELNPRRGAWIRERFEKSLDTLTEHGIISAWQYDRWDEAATKRRRWFTEWLQATVTIEPPDNIEEHYQEIERPGKIAPKKVTTPAPESLGPKIKARRNQLELTQMQAAEQLDITQAYFSQLERGKTNPGPALARRIQEWLGSA